MRDHEAPELPTATCPECGEVSDCYKEDDGYSHAFGYREVISWYTYCCEASVDGVII